MIPIYKPFLPASSLRFAHDAIRSGWFTTGKYKEMTTEKLKEEVNIKHLILLSSGTAATHLLAKCIQRFYPHINRIIVPNNVYVAVWNAFLYDSSEWTFEVAQTDLKTWNANYEHIKADENTAFLIVHNLGNIINLPVLKKRFSSSIFIEDNCEGFMGKYGKAASGTASLCSSLSFFANKNITSGQGGAFLTNDENLYDYAQNISHDGQSDQRYIHNNLGYNYSMTNIQAAILYGQLELLETIKHRKREVFSFYESELNTTERIVFQQTEADTTPSRWMFGLRIKGCDSYKTVQHFLAQKDIETRPFFYPISTHPYLMHHPLFEKADETNAKILSQECFMIPSYPGLTLEEQEKIIKAIKEFCKITSEEKK